MRSIGSIEQLYNTYADSAEFYLVYIREAHPIDGRARRDTKFKIRDPRTIAERRKAAEDFRDALNICVPILVDDMDDSVQRAYAAWPDRLYVVDAQGKIALKGAPGPRGFSPAVEAAADWLKEWCGKP